MPKHTKLHTNLYSGPIFSCLILSTAIESRKIND